MCVCVCGCVCLVGVIVAPVVAGDFEVVFGEWVRVAPMSSEAR